MNLTALSALKSRWNQLWSGFDAMPIKRKNQIFAVIVFFVGVFIYFVVLQPMQQAVVKLDKQIKTKEKLAAKNIQDVAQKPKVSDVYFRLLSAVAMPPGGNEDIRAAILRDIELSSRSNAISLTEIKPQVSTESDGFTLFFMNAQAEGALSQLTLFLTDLLRKEKLYFIDSLRVSPHPEDVNKVRANISIGRAALSSSISK